MLTVVGIVLFTLVLAVDLFDVLLSKKLNFVDLLVRTGMLIVWCKFLTMLE